VLGTSGPFQWSPDGKAIAWNGGGLRVTEIATGEEKSIAAKRTVTGYAWSPDSRQLAVASLDPGRPTTGFDIVDLATNSHRTVAFAPAEDAGSMINPLIIAGWQPDGRAVLAWVDEYASGSIAEDGLDLWLIPVDRSTPRKLTHTLVKPSWIQWSPNGTQLAIVRSSFRMVFGSERALTVCTTSAECTPITDPNAQTLDPSWSPDGKQIVFVREPPGQQPVVKKGGPAWSALYQTRRLWIANADGTDPHELPAAGRGVASPRWSPDGTHITFVRNRGLWSLDLASDRLTQLVKHIAPIAQTSSTHSYQTNPAPPDWAYEPTDANGMPTWESLVSMTN
jgi:Tol biopolymer transport system component